MILKGKHARAEQTAAALRQARPDQAEEHGEKSRQDKTRQEENTDAQESGDMGFHFRTSYSNAFISFDNVE